METLKTMVGKNPQLQSNKSEYLKLAIKLSGGGVKGTGPHKVRLIGVENATNQDYKTRKEIKGFHLLFEEDGIPKKYFIPTLGEDGKFHYLVERFAEIEERSELVMEYTRKEGSVRGFIDVRALGEQNGPEIAPETPQQTTDDDIPVVEEGEINVEDIPY